MEKPSVGVMGLAVMGSNLALNIESRKIPCAVYTRDTKVTEKFMAENAGKLFFGSFNLADFVKSLERPRKIILMIKAGDAVDQVLESLKGMLQPGDMVIDGGNSFYKDTERRQALAASVGINFLGVGISGGEEGARIGPSIMPGGERKAWENLAPILDKISAKADGPCTTYIGPGGSGHFVKMVHNGIEYADMQLIAEAYHLLKNLCGFSEDQLAQTFEDWNRSELSSFLIEITSKIFRQKDNEGSGYLVNKILDKAAQKGTGRWTIEAAMDFGAPVSVISAAVEARVLSSLKAERVGAAKGFPETKTQNRTDLALKVKDALYVGKMVAYAQGFSLMLRASQALNWSLNLSELARIWKGGCIIRAKFLDVIQQSYKQDAGLVNLLLSPVLKSDLEKGLVGMREVAALAAQNHIPVPAFGAALSYVDSYFSARLPQNLTQAQRDFFGAHTFERVDKPGVFHAKWG